MFNSIQRSLKMAISIFAVILFMSSYAMAHAETFQVELSDHRIVPGSMTGTENHEIHLTIHNAGKKVHNFVLPGFYIFTPNLPPNKSTTVEFTPDKKGMFQFFSDTGGHPEPGLVGTFHVK